MNLVIDIGNTLTKIAIFNGNELIDISVVEKNTFKSLENTLVRFPEITSSILSAVSDYDSTIINLLQSKGNVIELTHNTPVPFNNKYSTPETLGKDRIAIASAAAMLYPSENVLVIDAGTCVTYDFVAATGEYMGGSISPGLVMRLKALNAFTGKLPLESLPDPEINIDLIGDTTKTSILSGVILGLKSEVEHIINRYESLYSPIKIIVSGGDYKYFEKTSKSNIFASPNIVVHGLKEILNFNERN